MTALCMPQVASQLVTQVDVDRVTFVCLLLDLVIDPPTIKHMPEGSGSTGSSARSHAMRRAAEPERARTKDLVLSGGMKFAVCVFAIRVGG